MKTAPYTAISVFYLAFRAAVPPPESPVRAAVPNRGPRRAFPVIADRNLLRLPAALVLFENCIARVRASGFHCVRQWRIVVLRLQADASEITTTLPPH